ncbi:MAG: hypothetical protein IPK88_07785 [Saprospiraceae bacterium]|jgi:hypothetical protein|nr:hypothetical protein [Candidatus Defluviibacterium haderslevense]MBK8243310.1 hypothetical protein [Candidatus Defluviibacterium haderslevense]
MQTTIEKINTIFAMYPNTNGFGFVYMENVRKLVGFGSVRFNPISNKRILERIKKMFEDFPPTHIVLLNPESKVSRTGKRTKKLINEIMAFAESEKLPVIQYSRDQIRDVFRPKHVTKYEIAKHLLTEFEELKVYKPAERKLWMSEDRNMAIFDSLSLALTWFFLND